MANGVLSGVLWGVVVAVFGLAVASQIAPLPDQVGLRAVAGTKTPVADNDEAVPATTGTPAEVEGASPTDAASDATASGTARVPGAALETPAPANAPPAAAKLSQDANAAIAPADADVASLTEGAVLEIEDQGEVREESSPGGPKPPEAPVPEMAVIPAPVKAAEVTTAGDAADLGTANADAADVVSVDGARETAATSDAPSVSPEGTRVAAALAAPAEPSASAHSADAKTEPQGTQLPSALAATVPDDLSTRSSPPPIDIAVAAPPMTAAAPLPEILAGIGSAPARADASDAPTVPTPALATPALPTLAQADPAPAALATPAPPGPPTAVPGPQAPGTDAGPDPLPVPGLARVAPLATPNLSSDSASVVTGRLPAIGTDAPDGSNVAAVPAEDTVVADAPPRVRHARPFENPAARPVFAILLVDTGGADLDRQALAALPFPVSFVIDPLAPGAATAAEVYRAAGQEVLMLATGIPPGASAADLEVTFQAHAAELPQAVAVIDLQSAGFQDDRPLATQVVPVIAGQGRGLVTWDRGLNAAGQVAQREGLPSATIFRSLDAEGEAPDAIRRYLDRAVFKAAQDGRVVVIGSTRPETVAALLEWSVAERAASVALAPITAVLATP